MSEELPEIRWSLGDPLAKELTERRARRIQGEKLYASQEAAPNISAVWLLVRLFEIAGWRSSPCVVTARTEVGVSAKS